MIATPIKRVDIRDRAPIILKKEKTVMGKKGKNGFQTYPCIQDLFQN
jgi:hypothetical protein